MLTKRIRKSHKKGYSHREIGGCTFHSWCVIMNSTNRDLWGRCMELQKINQDNRERINQFIIHQWFTMQMVVHGESINLGEADGWYACDNNEIIGLVTYHIAGNEMEILSLDSLIENKGTGTALLHQALLDAKNAGLTRVRLITTNDNLHALRYYQKRGFDIIGFNYNALDEARKIKPEIPLTGMDGIPLKHEIELELLL